MLYNLTMNTISYLKEVYGYGKPIFLKDIRIGGKTKSSIRKELSRGVEKGEIQRESNGIYYLLEEKEIPVPISFEDVIEKKFIKNNYGIQDLDIDVYGYYTGMTFLHQIGITQQVPAVPEITTNNTSCKRIFTCNGYRAILRKGRTEINRLNHKALQFFDLFYLLDENEIKENKELLVEYIKKYLTKKDFEENIKYYPTRILKIIVEEGLINAFR